jgi:hypothetical protein
MDSRLIVNFLHVLIICPALIYVGFAREKIPPAAFVALGLTGIVVFFYHAYKFYNRGDNESGWVFLVHILLVAPLLMLIGFHGKETSRRFFEMLLLVAFAALGYHGLNIVRYYQ